MSSLNRPVYTLTAIRQELMDNSLQAKAIIQDTLSYRGTMEGLNVLNEAGREKLANLRKAIERLDIMARDLGDEALYNEVEDQRKQLHDTLQQFRKANISTMLEIEKANKEELFQLSPNASEVRQRVGKGTRTSMLNRSATQLMQHENVTERMLAITQQLHDTTQRSAANLETLIHTSAMVEATRDELHNMSSSIHQSRMLLEKYSRREVSDVVLTMLGLLLFLACVVYVLSRRLF
ncbi:vesicle transport protein SEC20-like [Anopheles albimanus]|uniref:Sec20 C-terminal domain-containing protein n=1 Tax=Anopheles albimanus TaxID=7167 RepID=A0A182FJ32_ANOAL|nr:vesicle transport protein SEC20-like [Anopheles albimanus]